MKIFADTETTGLIKSSVIDLNLQPEIIEVACIKTDDDLNEIDRIEFMVKPKLVGTELPGIITKITGITWNDVKDALPFEGHYHKLSEFFLGVDTFVAHNAAFDVGMFDLEIRRMGMQCKFPWPMIHHCTVQMVEEVGGFAKKNLGAVYEQIFHKKIENAHRAMNDVEAMLEVYKELLKRTKLKATPRVG